MQSSMKIVDPALAKAFFQDKMDFTTGPVELSHLIDDHADINIVDVREAEDFEKGHVPGAINLPKNRWSSLEGLSKDRVNILYCYTQQCHLAATAAVYFAERGYPVKEMEGGFEAWRENELPIQPASSNRLKGVTDRLLHKRH